MRHLAAFLLLILVVDVAARIGRKKSKEPKEKTSCKRMGTEQDAKARKKCNNYCKKERKCQRGVCVMLQGEKTCSCLNCNANDDKILFPFPPVPLDASTQMP
ncbi:hypothetical protein Y032_0007g3479 [Ancylostoma ceylanicum]|uniref:CRC domain-containing protein n=1 Tax=Ancylostoma ceylanicum TaxID=53326 RepID=A0A016VPA7_9BILA|nr:hypothetical protein Y032_0007g3479 [Ancylostoma ceylanicum]